MQTTTKLGGAAILACAACCAVSIVPAVLAGTSLVAIGGAASTWGVWLAALALPVVGIYAISRRKAAPNADVEVPSEADSCGCGAACGSSEALRADRLNV